MDREPSLSQRTPDMDTFPLSGMTTIKTELDEMQIIEPNQSKTGDKFPVHNEKMTENFNQKFLTQDEIIIQSNQQASTVYQWLMKNYEAAPGYSLPRCIVYEHYTDFCQRSRLQPVNAASFGKTIRQVFMELKTRRLGTRGQSKYHYYGIRVRHDSPYYSHLITSQRMSLPCPSTSMVSADHFKNFEFGSSLMTSGTLSPSAAGASDQRDRQKGEGEGGGGSSERFLSMMSPLNMSQKCREKNASFEKDHSAQLFKPLIQTQESSLLPEFPSACDLVNLPSTIDKAQMDDFLRDYRIHCTIIVEVILRGGLDEVEFYIKNFWSNLHLVQQRLVQNAHVCEVLAVCDTYLYHTVVGILIPGTLGPVPPRFLQGIRQFSCRFPRIMQAALASSPKHVAQNKMPVVKRFSQLMKRKTSLAHLSQASRSALAADVTINQMQLDWERRTEHDTVCSQLIWTMPQLRGASQQEIRKQMNVFQKLLESRASVEEHVRWVEEVRSFFVEKYLRDSKEYKAAERSFLAGWCYICSLIIRDQTLRSATSFGSFHLLNLLYEEYLLYVTEVHQYQQEEMDLWQRVMGEKTEPSEDFLQMDVDLDIDDCDDLQDLFPSPTKSMSSCDGDVFDMDITPGKLGLKEATRMTPKESPSATRNNPLTPRSAYRDIMAPSPGPAVKQSDIIPLAFAASGSSGDLPTPSLGNNDRSEAASKELGCSSTDKSAPVATCHAPSTVSSLSMKQTASSTKTPEKQVSQQRTPGQALNFITSKLVRATLLKTSDPAVTPPLADSEKGSHGNTSAEDKPSGSITLNIPSVPGLDLHQGQFLTAADGKKYVINDVQTVLQPAEAKPSQK